jgi:hypothetical protein
MALVAAKEKSQGQGGQAKPKPNFTDSHMAALVLSMER